MALLVGLTPEVFTNRSGRATLITRMAARGVPDEVGMLISGHHSTGGYLRYDRTQRLKMEAATLVSSNPALDYEKALSHVSKKFVAEELVGSCSGLKPLVSRVSENSNLPMAITNLLQVREEQHMEEKEPTNSSEGSNSKRSRWERNYDDFDWENAILTKDPELFKRMSSLPKSPRSVGSNMSGNAFHNCSVTIKFVHPNNEEDKENSVGPS